MTDVDDLLKQCTGGDRDSESRLMDVVYVELRQIASSLLRKEPANRTLQTTALVHEAYLRLGGAQELSVPSRQYFFGAAAQAMRRVLVDHARGMQRQKRTGERVDLNLAELPANGSTSIIDLDDALERLAMMDARQAKVVELRFFCGLSSQEAAEVLGISETTAKRDWIVARAWLKGELQ